MIRPFTCVCVLLAAGSGLYLYQTKQRTLMLDRQISQVLKHVDEARARTATLKAEYAELSQPDRLLTLSQHFLALRPTAPTQFTQLAALDQHLPPIEAFPKPGDTPPPAPVPPVALADAAIAASTLQSDPEDEDISPALPAPADATAPRVLASAATAVAPPHQAPHASKRPALPPATAYAANLHAEPTPLAVPRPVAASVLATAAFHPAHSVPYRVLARPDAVAGGVPITGSMLGGSSSVNLAPPVPVAN